MYIRYPYINATWTFDTAADLPAMAPDGQLALTLDTFILYAFRTNTDTWIVIGGAGSILSMGTFDSGTPSATGAHIDLNLLVMQSASATLPGLVNTTTQSFTGIKTFLSGINLNSQAINSLLDPVSAQQAATKNYVDNVASGLAPIQACYAASTTNLVGVYNNGASGVGATFTITATGAFTIDGTTPPLNSRILLKDQTLGFQNGIYDLTTVGSIGVSPVLTRSSDFDTPTNMNSGDLTPVINGTLNALTSWLQTSTIVTVGTTDLVYIEWSYNPNNFISSIGTIDSETKSANGAVRSGMTLVLQNADATFPGLVSTGTQTFAGAKTFTGAISASNLSGTNTGDVTLGTASGLSLVGQVLSLALSSTSTTGALSNTDWNTFNGKQAAGNYITALTSDVTASGPGSAAATIANNVVTNAKLAQMAAHTFKGNNTGSTANALDLTATELTAELNLFTNALKGLVPLSGGGTTNFLRADGSWAVPAGGSAATPSVAGLVTSYTPVVKSSVNAVSSASYVGLESDGYNVIQFSTGASDRTYTTPAVANSNGRKIKLVKTDTGAGNVTIVLGDGSLIGVPNSTNLYAQGASCEIECDGSNWYVTKEAINYTTISTTFTFNGTGSPGTTGSVTVQLTRIGNTITLTTPSTTATSGTNSNTLTANTAVPAWATPSGTRRAQMNATLVDNGTIVTSPGVYAVNTSGIILLEKVNGNYTNTTTCGLQYQTALTYIL